MKSPMQLALGPDWDKLPPALQAHYRAAPCRDGGHLDIDYPRPMQPYLSLLHRLGALLHRRGHQVATTVDKTMVGDRQHWRRTLTYPDGRTLHFNSIWEWAGGNHIIEFVNPVLGLQMAVRVEDQRLHYRGVRFVAQLGPWRLTIPEWLVLGHTRIEEQAVDDHHFVMDFRLIHPWFGQLFRYAGRFASDMENQGTQA